MVLLSSAVFLLIFCPVDVSFLIERAEDSGNNSGFIHFYLQFC